MPDAVAARDRSRALIPLLVALASLAAVVSLAVGPARIPLAAVGDALGGHGDPIVRAIILQLRLPRTLLALLVGAMLGCAGAALQGYLRNPLAEPGVLGVSGTASLGAVIAIYWKLAEGHAWMLPLLAVAGAVAALAPLLVLSARSESPLTLVLAGVALATLSGAGISLALNLAPNPFAAMEIATWLLGSLEDRSATDLWVALPCVAVGLTLMLWDGRALDALTLGEDGARARRGPAPGAAAAARRDRHRSRRCGRGVGVDRLRGADRAASRAALDRSQPLGGAGARRAGGRGAAPARRRRRPADPDARAAEARRAHRLPRRAGVRAPPAEGAPPVVTLAARRLSVALGGRAVLHDVDFAGGPGELIGLIGPNGAGKSTLARALLGLVAPSGGRALIDGADAGALGAAGIARRVAYLPQGQDIHWPISVERLVGLGRLPHLAPFSRMGEEDRAAIRAALAETGTAHLAGRVATELSGGERARVLLARALATGASALVADEPLASLDPGHQIDVMALLAARARAAGPVVAVLHDLSVAARYCDRLVLLHRGRVHAAGSVAEVLTDDTLADVYGVAAWRAEANGLPLLLPVSKVRP